MPIPRKFIDKDVYAMEDKIFESVVDYINSREIPVGLEVWVVGVVEEMGIGYDISMRMVERAMEEGYLLFDHMERNVPTYISPMRANRSRDFMV